MVSVLEASWNRDGDVSWRRSPPPLGVRNLTGYPALALKAGFYDNRPLELMVTGRRYDEATLLRVALAFERNTEWHLEDPTL